jgi:hypothetical protein
VKAHVIEPLVWAHLTALLRQPETLLVQLREAQATAADTRAVLERELTTAGAQAEAAQVKLDRLVERNLEGTIDEATYQRLYVTLIAARDASRQRVVDAQHALAAAQEERHSWQSIRGYCADVSTRLAELEQPENFDRQQRLVQTLIRQVIVSPTSVQIKGILPCVDTPPEGPEPTGLCSHHHKVETAKHWLCPFASCCYPVRRTTAGHVSSIAWASDTAMSVALGISGDSR